MQFISHCTKVIDDLLFVNVDLYAKAHQYTAYCCIHIPSLVISTQLPGGSLSLTKNAFDVLLPKCIMESHATESTYFVQTKIYSIPACPPTRPRYCFIIRRAPRQSWGVDWEVLEVEIDLSIPGPIKIFSRVGRQYTRQATTYLLHNNDDNLLLSLPLGRGYQPSAPLSVRFLRVGKPGKVRVARLGGIDEMYLSGILVDRDAGYVIIWTQSHCDDSFICWLDERKPDNLVYSRTKELISSWNRRLLRRV